MKSLRLSLAKSTMANLFISVMAGIVTAALLGLVYYSIQTLSSRDWCNQIMAAEKFVGDKTVTDPRTVQIVIAKCTDVLSLQLESVGWVAKILAGALAMCVAVMYIVRFAGAEASGEIAGNKFKFQKDDDDDNDDNPHPYPYPPPPVNYPTPNWPPPMDIPVEPHYPRIDESERNA